MGLRHLVKLPSNVYLPFRGATSISPDFSALVAANIRSGLDWYRLPTTRQISKVSTSLEVQDKNANFPLPVQFINKGRAVLMGTNKGNAVIFHSEHGGRMQTLAHGTRELSSSQYSP